MSPRLDSSPGISVVVPVYDEVESLEELYSGITTACEQLGRGHEIIFIDDGCRDGSDRKLDELAKRDARVQVIHFRRNFGKSPALAAGFERVRGEIVLTLDADLQDDPREIPRFLAATGEGLDVVSGWKQVRYDPWHKVLPSRVFNAMVSWLTGVRLHDHNCGMKCYRREVLREVRLYGELHRFVPVLAAAKGFTVGELVIRHRPRKHGSSKYGVGRFIKGFLDLLTVKFLTGFGQRPQHLLGAIGLLCFSLGGLGLAYLACYWIAGQINADWQGTPLHQRPAVIYSMGALLLGGQLMSIGFLAELITAYQFRESDTYSVAERTAERADQKTPSAS